jgi:hypothetical protein
MSTSLLHELPCNTAPIIFTAHGPHVPPLKKKIEPGPYKCAYPGSNGTFCRRRFHEFRWPDMQTHTLIGALVPFFPGEYTNTFTPRFTRFFQYPELAGPDTFKLPQSGLQPFLSCTRPSIYHRTSSGWNGPFGEYSVMQLILIYAPISVGLHRIRTI